MRIVKLGQVKTSLTHHNFSHVAYLYICTINIEELTINSGREVLRRRYAEASHVRGCDGVTRPYRLQATGQKTALCHIPPCEELTTNSLLH